MKGCHWKNWHIWEAETWKRPLNFILKKGTKAVFWNLVGCMCSLSQECSSLKLQKCQLGYLLSLPSLWLPHPVLKLQSLQASSPSLPSILWIYEIRPRQWMNSKREVPFQNLFLPPTMRSAVVQLSQPEHPLLTIHQRIKSEFKQTLGDNEGQGSLACCSPWGRRVGYNWATERQEEQNKTS